VVDERLSALPDGPKKVLFCTSAAFRLLRSGVQHSGSCVAVELKLHSHGRGYFSHIVVTLIGSESML
jgi:hypothetical protein